MYELEKHYLLHTRSYTRGIYSVNSSMVNGDLCEVSKIKIQ
jgi:hypothetical protein